MQHSDIKVFEAAYHVTKMVRVWKAGGNTPGVRNEAPDAGWNYIGSANSWDTIEGDHWRSVEDYNDDDRFVCWSQTAFWELLTFWLFSIPVIWPSIIIHVLEDLCNASEISRPGTNSKVISQLCNVQCAETHTITRRWSCIWNIFPIKEFRWDTCAIGIVGFLFLFSFYYESVKGLAPPRMVRNI